MLPGARCATLVVTSTEGEPMPSTSQRMISPSPRRAIAGGVVAVVILTSIVGGLAGAATWGVLQAIGVLMP